MAAYNASIAIQTLPQVEGDEVLRVVDRVIEYIAGTGLSMHVGPFETTIEGDFDTIWDVAKQCQLICIREGAPAVWTYMKVFYNPNHGIWSIDEKVAKYHGENSGAAN